MFYETDRLYIREWLSKDIAPLAKINSSPIVMEFFPNVSSYDYTCEFIDQCKAHHAKYGFSIFAIELKETFELIGFCGLKEIDIEIPSLSNLEKPIFEIKWRVSHNHWGKGYAPEAAQEILNLAFSKFKLNEVIAFTSKLNLKSIRVMEKLKMKHDPNDDFVMEIGEEEIRPHLVYRLSINE